MDLGQDDRLCGSDAIAAPRMVIAGLSGPLTSVLVAPRTGTAGLDGPLTSVLVAPQGFEPRSSESESLVLPLNERAIQVVREPQVQG